MPTLEEADRDHCRFCGAAAFATGVLHIVAIFVFSYRHLPADIAAIDFSPPNDGLTMFLVNYGTFLAPLVVVFLSRKLAIALALCAVPILLNLSMQLYYEWLFLTTGTNPGMRQKGDWVTWLPTMLGVLAVAALAMWLFAVVLWLIGSWLDRVVGPGRSSAARGRDRRPG